MKRFAFTSVVVALLFAVSVISSACNNEPRRIVTAMRPLAEPIYQNNVTMTMSVDDPLGKRFDYIFKGKINHITEYNVKWNGSQSEGTWFSVCDVEIGSTLYGANPGRKQNIKLIFMESTRRLSRSDFRLLEGDTYYFVTHLFNQNDIDSQNKDDLFHYYEYGDAVSSASYLLLPILEGKVLYHYWEFDGQSEQSANRFTEHTTSSLEESCFLEQFNNLINTTKQTLPDGSTDGN